MSLTSEEEKKTRKQLAQLKQLQTQRYAFAKKTAKEKESFDTQLAVQHDTADPQKRKDMLHHLQEQVTCRTKEVTRGIQNIQKAKEWAMQHDYHAILQNQQRLWYDELKQYQQDLKQYQRELNKADLRIELEGQKPHQAIIQYITANKIKAGSPEHNELVQIISHTRQQIKAKGEVPSEAISAAAVVQIISETELRNELREVKPGKTKNPGHAISEYIKVNNIKAGSQGSRALAAIINKETKGNISTSTVDRYINKGDTKYEPKVLERIQTVISRIYHNRFTAPKTKEIKASWKKAINTNGAAKSS